MYMAGNCPFYFAKFSGVDGGDSKVFIYLDDLYRGRSCIQKESARQIICKVIFMGFTVIAAGVGIVVCQGLIRQPQSSPVLGLPMVWVYAALPVGMGLTTLRQLQNIILELLAMRRGRCSEKEKGGC